MGFWLKRIIVMILVIMGAAAFILFMPQNSELDEQGNPIEKKSIESNMAKFYEEFSLVSNDRIEENYGDYVIPLEPQSAPLSQQLNALKRSTVKNNENFEWQGSYKSRYFAKDSTLMTDATGYVSEEGMRLIWHLNQDFIVKQRFSSENTISGMLQELASAIDANFTGTVSVYYCEQQRVMVITDKTDSILDNSCMELRRF
jgi:hypothetical protein